MCIYNFKKKIEESCNTFINNEKFKNFCFFSKNKIIYKKLTNFTQSKEKHLLIYGKLGTGKTHLINQFLKNKKNFFYIDANNLINIFYKYLRQKIPFNTLFEILLSKELLIFDSFDQIVKHHTSITEFTYSLLKKITKQKIIFVFDLDDSKDEKILLNLDNKLVFPNPEKEDIKEIILNFLKTYNSNIKINDEIINLVIDYSGINIQKTIDKIIEISFYLNNMNENSNSKKFMNEFFKREEKKEYIEVCKKLNFNENSIFLNTRKKDIVYKRNLVIYILKKKYLYSNQELSDLFNKNHSTIIHSINQIEKKLENNSFKKYIKELFE